MILDRKKNTKKGIVHGVVNRSCLIIFPFLVQTAIIKSLGAEYAGIKGVFSSILLILSLSELGVGSAITYSMYKPIAEDDIVSVCALLNLYKKLYIYIGCIVFALGIFLVPFLSFIVKDEYPAGINIYLVYILFLINTVVSYLFYSYNQSILNAYQRTDVISTISTITTIIISIIQIFLLYTTGNFYLVLIFMIFSTLISNYIASICVKKLFPQIHCYGVVSEGLKREIKKNVSGLLVDRICGATRNTFDTIFISMYLGLTQTAIYSNYFMILSSMNSMMSVLLTSMLGGIGNSIVTESKEDNYERMMMLHSLYVFLGGWIAICMLCLYQPFMQIWVGDDLMFSDCIMVLYPIYFFIGKLGDIRSVFSDGAGLFWENRYRILIEAFANIILNYLFVIKWGVFGIMLATIITLFVFGFIGSSLVIFKYYFVNGIFQYLLNTVYYVVSTFASGFLVYFICRKLEYITKTNVLFIRCIICITVLPLIYLSFFLAKKDFKKALFWLKNIIKY